VAGEIEANDNATKADTGDDDAGQATVTVYGKAPKTPPKNPPEQKSIGELIPNANDVPEPYRNITIVYGKDWGRKTFVRKSIANLAAASRAKGYSPEQIHLIEVKDAAALAAAVKNAPPSAALVTVFHADRARIYLTGKDNFMSYKVFDTAISKASQGQPWGPTILWGCNMHNAGRYLATTYNWPNWVAVGKASGATLYGEGGIVQWP